MPSTPRETRLRAALKVLGGLVILAGLARYVGRDLMEAFGGDGLARIAVPCGDGDSTRRVYDTPGGRFCLEKDSTDVIKSNLRRNVVWEEHLLGVYRARIKPGDVVVDAGAHIGTHTLQLARMVGAKGRVLAFEPQLKTYQELLVNLDLNDVHNVQAEFVALGSENRRVSMNAANPGNEGATKVGHGGNRVELRTLDSYHLERVDFLKIDVEGFERYLLEGARETIRRHHPPMLIEIWPENRDKVLPLLADLGYETRSLGGDDFVALPRSAPDGGADAIR